MIYWATLFVAIATSMAGQILLKAGAGAMEIDAIFTRPLRAAQEKEVKTPLLQLLEFALRSLQSV